MSICKAVVFQSPFTRKGLLIFIRVVMSKLEGTRPQKILYQVGVYIVKDGLWHTYSNGTARMVYVFWLSIIEKCFARQTESCLTYAEIEGGGLGAMASCGVWIIL